MRYIRNTTETNFLQIKPARICVQPCYFVVAANCWLRTKSGVIMNVHYFMYTISVYQWDPIDNNIWIR